MYVCHMYVCMYVMYYNRQLENTNPQPANRRRENKAVVTTAVNAACCTAIDWAVCGLLQPDDLASNCKRQLRPLS